jgi:hypothetical protein
VTSKERIIITKSKDFINIASKMIRWIETISLSLVIIRAPLFPALGWSGYKTHMEIHVQLFQTAKLAAKLTHLGCSCGESLL